jgi:hypothetical protein
VVAKRLAKPVDAELALVTRALSLLVERSYTPEMVRILDADFGVHIDDGSYAVWTTRRPTSARTARERLSFRVREFDACFRRVRTGIIGALKTQSKTEPYPCKHSTGRAA